MRIAIIGTGMVGRALARKLDALGHDVVIGTRDPQKTLAIREVDVRGNVPFTDWLDQYPGIRLAAFEEAGRHGELIINATAGAISRDALTAVGAAQLAGKVLLDVALPLDLSNGMPPTLSVANTDSLGEQIQRTFPDTRVVKSLNTVSADVMIDPARVPGDHVLFLSGDDTDAKSTVREILVSFGWSSDLVYDLGAINSARAAEMYSRLFFTLAASLGSFDLNISIHRPGSAPRGEV